MVPWIAHGKFLTTEAERVQRRSCQLAVLYCDQSEVTGFVK